MGSLVKPLTWVLGVALLIVGILGFVMESPLLGLFEVDLEHNIVHVLSGLVGIGAAVTGYQYSRLYLIIFGLVYGLVTVLGFLLPDQSGELLNLVSINMADNFLHLAISAASLLVGFASPKAVGAPVGPMAAPLA